MNVTQKMEILAVSAEYNKNFIRKVKGLKGKWNPDEKTWDVPLEYEEQLYRLLKDVYGYLPSDQTDMTTIQINAADFEDSDDGKIKLGSMVLVWRPGRDSYVRLSDNVAILKGEFAARGGSAKYPMVNAGNGVILQVKNVPKALLKSIPDEKYTVEMSTINKELLLEEKQKLMDRLEEIELLLKEEVKKIKGKDDVR